jgi:hypothetical protein
MSTKIHQSSETHYQTRVDGKPVGYHSSIGKDEINEWLKLCAENEGCYVDIVQIRTEILMNQYNYHLMKKHFSNQEQAG